MAGPSFSGKTRASLGILGLWTEKQGTVTGRCLGDPLGQVRGRQELGVYVCVYIYSFRTSLPCTWAWGSQPRKSFPPYSEGLLRGYQDVPKEFQVLESGQPGSNLSFRIFQSCGLGEVT